MIYTCIVVEDEPLAQKVLEKYIADTPSLELVGVCADAFQAQKFLQNHQVQLIFLDVNLPKLSGISFLKSLVSPPRIIFTTAYPEFAVEGFDLDATDYLLKPFSYERFYKAVQKAIHSLIPSAILDKNEFIMLKADKKIHKINLKDIQYLEAYGDYVKVHLNDKMLVVYETLKNLTAQLPSQDFIRIHKSYLISLAKIEYIDGNQVKICEKLLPLSLNYKDELMRALGGK